MAVYPEYPKGKEIYPEPVANFVYSLAETLDEFTDSIAGLRVTGHTLELLRLFAPANVIRKVTGIPKPSEIVEAVLDEIDETLGEPILERFPRLRRFV